MPPDLTRLGETTIHVNIGIENALHDKDENRRKTVSQSTIELKITDKCPNGYFCNDYAIQECPLGFYCKGGAYKQDKRPCPIGYF